MDTTDFQDWLNDNVFNHHDVWNVYQCFSREEDVESFKFASKENQVFITGPQSKLVISGKKAIKYFPEFLYNKYAKDFPDLEAWYGYKFAEERNKDK